MGRFSIVDEPIVKALGVILVLFLLQKFLTTWNINRRLKAIPTAGRTGFITSYIDAIDVIRDPRGIINEGYAKFRGRLFKVPQINQWMVLASGTKLIDDVRRMSEDQGSAVDAVAELLQTDYTIAPDLRHDFYHVEIVRTTLTRQIGARFQETLDEAMLAFSEEVPVTNDWTSVRIVPAVTNIACRAANRFLLGIPLCRNKDFIGLNVRFTHDVIEGAARVTLLPDFLKPLVARFFAKGAANVKEGIRILKPVIEERLRCEEEYGPNWEDRPNDLLSWLLDVAKGDQRTVRSLALRVLFVNFGAIHTTSMSFCCALYRLLTRPEYIQPLREEVETVLGTEGWSKASFVKLKKLDSFIRESNRLLPAEAGPFGLLRKLKKDFTFSDGTTVPKGVLVGVTIHQTHDDEEFYTHSKEFDAFRFSDLRADGNEKSAVQNQAVMTGLDYLTFGHGRHACPGRFFAVNELKIMLSHLLLTYDIKFPDGKDIPRWWFDTPLTPDPEIEVMFRKRAI